MFFPNQIIAQLFRADADIEEPFIPTTNYTSTFDSESNRHTVANKVQPYTQEL